MGLRRGAPCLGALLVGVVGSVMGGVVPASAASTGCITYVDYIYQADKNSQNQAGNGASLTTSAPANSANNSCQNQSGTVREALSTQYAWDGSAWVLCDVGSTDVESGSAAALSFSVCSNHDGYFGTSVGNRVIGYHKAWFFGEPWSSTTIIDD